MATRCQEGPTIFCALKPWWCRMCTLPHWRSEQGREGAWSHAAGTGLFRSIKHISYDATDLLSASMFVKSSAEFIPIQDESSNFGHVAGKHCLHAWDKETRAKQKRHADRLLRRGGRETSWHTYFLPLTALYEPPYFLRFPINSMISGT